MFYIQKRSVLFILIFSLLWWSCGFKSFKDQSQISISRKPDLRILVNDSTEDSLSDFFYSNVSEETLVIDIYSKSVMDRRRIIFGEDLLPVYIIMKFHLPYVDDIKVYKIFQDSSLQEIKDMEILSFDSLGNEIFHAGLDRGSYYQINLADLPSDLIELSVSWILYLY
ncbi:MAG: hypothetical protein ACP5FK_11455 [bacterium]